MRDGHNRVRGSEGVHVRNVEHALQMPSGDTLTRTCSEVPLSDVQSSSSGGGQVVRLSELLSLLGGGVTRTSPSPFAPR